MKLNYKRVVLIGMAFLSISAFWQMYDNIIPLILQNSFGMGETVTGAVMASDNVLALFLLPLFGTLSDKANTKIGKRMPFIVAGTLLSVFFLLLLPGADRAGNLIFFVGGLFALLLSMGLYRSPAVALMPDLTPGPLRSKANAVINLMGAIGGIYALLMIKLLVGKGARPDYMPLFLSIALLMLFAVLLLFLTIRENKLRISQNEDMEDADGSAAAGKGERMPPEVRRSFGFLLASIFLWFMAYNAVTTAFSRYTKVVWRLEGGSFADCLMVAMGAAIISFLPIGHLSGRIGRKKTILGGVFVMSFCYLAAIFVGSYHPAVNILFAFIGIGWAAINVNSYPMIMEMCKGHDIGKYTGTYYTFSMAAQILTPILSGLFLEHISYRTLFPYAFACSVAAFFTMRKVRHGDIRVSKKTKE